LSQGDSNFYGNRGTVQATGTTEKHDQIPVIKIS